MRRTLTPLLLVPIGFIALAALGAASGWAAVRALQPLDLALVQTAVANRSASLTPLMHRFSDLGGEITVIVILAIALLALLIARRWVDALGVLGAVVGSLYLYEFIVRWVGRHRPPVQHLENPGGSSFPSGHVANSTALYLAILLAVFVFVRRRRLRVLLLAVALVLVTAIAVSRIYLGLHYPSDIAAGFLIGVGWALIVRYALSGVEARFEPVPS
ncbi:MAG: phosphatase PAP2 family protein [Candidatus Dormibacteraeota bacterium]|nr:phosphatase PAP2 family protein [Candidatus Dormibacteraeota bacterium]